MFYCVRVAIEVKPLRQLERDDLIDEAANHKAVILMTRKACEYFRKSLTLIAMNI